MASLARLSYGGTRHAQNPKQRTTNKRRFRFQSTLQSVTPPAVERALSVPCEVLCPICLKTVFTVEPDSTDQLYCHRCHRSFDRSSKYVDLTLSSGIRDKDYAMQTGLGRSLFENPFVGFVYERGWRDSFARAGFPGPDAEFESAMEWLSPAAGDAVMDLCCGSGLFTRRFLTSGAFNSVVSVDFSEAMLTQTKQYIEAMKTTPKATSHLIRADVSRLPFETASFKAVYSGAAIHCWENPAMAIAEISRILKPGGVFVFSTFTQFSKEFDDALENLGLEFVKGFIGRRRTISVIMIPIPFSVVSSD